jgi:transcription antitermination factor NusG
MSCSQPVCPLPHQLRWYALRTRSRAEQLVATGLQAKGYEQYLPSYRVRRRWSDRTVEATLPLFPGYVFCRFDGRERVPVLTTCGVASIIGFGPQLASIPDSEIEAIQSALDSGLQVEPCPFLREGQRIRVSHGALKGVEGILLKKKSEWRLVVSVTLLHRSVSVEFDQDCVTPV